jgi:hypothetical protein
VTIEIPNRTSRAWEVSITAELNPSALFHRASDGPSIRWRTTEAFLGIAWPALVVPARSIADVRYDVIVRYDTLAPPLVTSVRLSAQDAETRTGYVSDSSARDVQIDPVVNEARSGDRFNPLPVLALAMILSAVALPSTIVLWRAGRRRSGQQRMALRVGAFTVASIAIITSLALSTFAWLDWKALDTYRETTCKVTERILDARETGEARGGALVSFYAILVGVDVAMPGGVRPNIAGDSDNMPGEIYIDADAKRRVAAYVPGQSYRCWYHVTDTHEIAMEYRISAIKYVALGALLLLVSIPGIVVSIFRWTV